MGRRPVVVRAGALEQRFSVGRCEKQISLLCVEEAVGDVLGDAGRGAQESVVGACAV